MSTQKMERIGQRAATQTFFKKNADMDFYLLWMLSYQTEKGAEIGECYYAASCIDEREPESWIAAWLTLANRTEDRANNAFSQGHLVSAREAYLRAFTYYRGATFYLRPGDPRFRETFNAFEANFQKATALLDPAFEPVTIPFEGNSLPGYLVKAANGAEKHPTLIMVGGGESFREDLYFWAGAAGARRGYNVLLVDLPGQGGTPFAGLSIRDDTEVPIQTIVDYLLTRPEVDPRRIAIHGLSGGGYFVTRGAAFEHRLRACIANSPIIDLHRVVTQEMPAFLQKLPSFASNAAIAWAGRQNPSLAITLEKICWQAGVTTLSDFVDRTKSCNLNGLVERISCPTLCLGGDAEGDTGEASRQLHAFYNALTIPQKAVVIFTAADGANAHCQVGNFSLSHQVAFDWLDQVMR